MSFSCNIFKFSISSSNCRTSSFATSLSDIFLDPIFVLSFAMFRSSPEHSSSISQAKRDFSISGGGIRSLVGAGSPSVSLLARRIASFKISDATIYKRLIVNKIIFNPMHSSPSFGQLSYYLRRKVTASRSLGKKGSVSHTDDSYATSPQINIFQFFHPLYISVYIVANGVSLNIIVQA